MGSMDTEGGDPQVLRGRGVRFRADLAAESVDDHWLTPIGSATNPTWADITMPLNFPPFRFRMCASNESGAETDRQIKLRASYNSGSYQHVSINGFYVKQVATTWYTTSSDATDYGSDSDLWTGAWADADNNWLVEENDITGRCSFGAGQPKRMEGEWMLALVPENLSVNDTIELRCYGNAESAFNCGYDCPPKISIAPAVAHPEAWFVKHNRVTYSRIVGR